METTLQKADKIAESLRQEPYSFLTNDCIIKSIRLVRDCRKQGIKARVVLTIGHSQARLPWIGKWTTIPVIHSWGEVEGKRMEVSRPLGAQGMWGIVPRDIQPIVKIRF